MDSDDPILEECRKIDEKMSDIGGTIDEEDYNELITYTSFCESYRIEKKRSDLVIDPYEKRIIEHEAKSNLYGSIINIIHYLTYGFAFAIAILYQNYITSMIESVLSFIIGDISTVGDILIFISAETIVFFAIVFMLSFISTRVTKKKYREDMGMSIIKFLRRKEYEMRVNKDDGNLSDIFP